MKNYKVEIQYTDNEIDENSTMYQRDFSIATLYSDIDVTNLYLNKFEIDLIKSNKTINLEGNNYNVTDLIFKLSSKEKSIILIVKNPKQDDLPF